MKTFPHPTITIVVPIFIMIIIFTCHRLHGHLSINTSNLVSYVVYRYLSCHIYPIDCNAKSERKPEGMKV